MGKKVIYTNIRYLFSKKQEAFSKRVFFEKSMFSFDKYRR